MQDTISQSFMNTSLPRLNTLSTTFPSVVVDADKHAQKRWNHDVTFTHRPAWSTHGPTCPTGWGIHDVNHIQRQSFSTVCVHGGVCRRVYVDNGKGMYSSSPFFVCLFRAVPTTHTYTCSRTHSFNNHVHTYRRTDVQMMITHTHTHYFNKHVHTYRRWSHTHTDLGTSWWCRWGSQRRNNVESTVCWPWPWRLASAWCMVSLSDHKYLFRSDFSKVGTFSMMQQLWQFFLSKAFRPTCYRAWLC